MAREVKVIITGDNRRLSQAFGAAARDADGFGSKLAHFGRIAGTAFAGLAVGIGAAGAKAITAASDLSESMSKIGVVFGTAQGQVTAFADHMASAFGLPKQQILDAAANIGLVAKGAGLSQDAAAGMSTQLAGLAADASSFFNVPLPDALEKIRSGLVGEAEPLRAFGVLLSEDAVKQEAYRLGIAETGAELTEQQKVMARSSLIASGLKDATGDLERTQDSLANKMRKLKGTLENTMASVGAALAPVATQVLQALEPLIPILGDALGGAATALAPAIQAIVPLFAQLAPLITTLATALTPIATALITTLASALQQLMPALQPLIAALGAGLLQVLVAIAPLLPELAAAMAQIAVAITPLIPVVAQLATVLATVLAFGMRTIVGMITGFLVPAITFLSDIVVSGAHVIGAIWNWLKGTAIAVWNGIKNAILNPISAARDTLVSVFNSIRDRLLGAWDSIRSGISSAVDAVIGFFRRMWDKASEYVDKIVAAIKRLPFVPGSPIPMVTWAQQTAAGVQGALGGLADDVAIAAAPLTRASAESRVAPARSLGIAAAASGAPTINIQIDVHGDVTGQEILEKVQTGLLKMFRRNNFALGGI